MLKKLVFVILFFGSLFLVAHDVEEEVTTIVNYQNEKLIMEKEPDKIIKLEIPEWNFERIVKEGSVNQIDNLFATLLVGNQNNVVIAGHDIPIVFHDLQNVQLEMNIYLKKGNKITEYIVVEKKAVVPTEVVYLEETEDERLTLITCTENDQKRLIIICIKNNVS